MRRTLLFFAFLLLTIVGVKAQDTTVTIGTSGTGVTYVPYDCRGGNSFSEMIYTFGEIGKTGDITSIAFHVNANVVGGLSGQNIKIFMGMTDGTPLSSGFVDTNSLTLVYSHTDLTMGSRTGWSTITLDNSFSYDNRQKNLVIAVVRKNSSSNGNLKHTASNVSASAGLCRYWGDYLGNVSTPTKRPNIQLTIAPIVSPYPEPATLTATSITANSATINWTNAVGSTPTSWNLAYGPAGFNVETQGTHVNGLNSTTYTINGLSAATHYDVYVQAVYAEGNSSWKQADFRTECPAYASVPFSENFDGYVGVSIPEAINMPSCWGHINTSGATNWYQYFPYINNSNTMTFTSSSACQGSQYAILPAFENLDGLQLRFNIRYSTISSDGGLEVGLMSDPADENTFIPIQTITPASTSWETAVVNFLGYSGSAHHIALRTVYDPIQGNNTSLYIDNVVVKTPSNEITYIAKTAVDGDPENENEIRKSEVPDNTVCTEGEPYAHRIVLTDSEEDFDIPMDFHADEVVFERNFYIDRPSTICLPFATTAAHRSNFNLYSYTEYNGGTATFTLVNDRSHANVPYIIEYKTAKDGTFQMPTLQDVDFEHLDGSMPVVEPNGCGFNFVGTFAKTVLNDINYHYYGLYYGYFVESGNGTNGNAAATVIPFRSYFYSTFTLPTSTGVDLRNEGEVSIELVDPEMSIKYSNDVYDLMGRCVRKNADSLRGLPQGIYIWKGKKMLNY